LTEHSVITSIGLTMNGISIRALPGAPLSSSGL